MGKMQINAEGGAWLCERHTPPHLYFPVFYQEELVRVEVALIVDPQGACYCRQGETHLDEQRREWEKKRS